MYGMKLFFLLSLPVILASCATLNKSECLDANGQAIGLEDGSNGRDKTYAHKHDKACGEYGVKPDIAQYQVGYEAGLVRFCTAGMGYWLGDSGQEYKDVCPVGLRGDHLKGYEIGHRNYMILEGLD